MDKHRSSEIFPLNWAKVNGDSVGLNSSTLCSTIWKMEISISIQCLLIAFQPCFCVCVSEK